jgi:hypothetical protein
VVGIDGLVGYLINGFSSICWWLRSLLVMTCAFASLGNVVLCLLNSLGVMGGSLRGSSLQVL